MSDCVISQAIWCTLFLAEAAFLLWHYHRTVSRPVAIRAFRQRLFALRDRAILLVAEGQAREDDPDWLELYRALNHSAKTTTVGEMKNGLSFVLKLLRTAKPPTPEERTKLGQLPRPLLELWIAYIGTVFSIMWEGSFLLRTIVRLAQHFGAVKRLIERRRPEEAESYRQWKSTADQCEKEYGHSRTGMTTVGC